MELRGKAIVPTIFRLSAVDVNDVIFLGRESKKSNRTQVINL